MGDLGTWDQTYQTEGIWRLTVQVLVSISYGPSPYENIAFDKHRDDM